jgi:hypothetical protein
VKEEKGMATKEILYAAYKDEDIDESLSYAIYLAGQLGAGLRILLLDRLGLSEKLDNVMAAITFAEAGEHETARSFLSDDGKVDGNSQDTAALLSHLINKCGEEGVKANIHAGNPDSVEAIKDFLKQGKVEMVVLSPGVTKTGGILKRLTKISASPVVTMAR